MADADPTIKTPITPEWLCARVVEVRNCLIVVESGPEAGRCFGPLREVTIVGREDWSDIALTDPRVSKQHCELAWTPDGLRLRDLGSTNGVLCDGIRVYDVVLMGERRFQVGSTVLSVIFEEASQQRTTYASDASRTVLGASPPMRRLFSIMERLAGRELPVLLLGETGTGKTAVAQAIHKVSSRRSNRFLSINCAALPAELVESTLFGHVRGAFTGAHRATAGLFEQATGGSVLLDEIGEMPLALQAKLLTVLEARCVRPVGSEREVPVDFRLFCASNRNLAADAAEGRFRQDLYYRIAGIEVVIPPLRDRLGDVSMLAKWFLLAHARRIRESGGQCDAHRLSEEALRMLEQHSWPGNVRELENVIGRAVALATTESITTEDVLLTTWNAGYEELGPAEGSPSTAGGYPVGDVGPFREFKAALLDMHERAYLQRLLVQTQGNITRAAQVSGLSRVHIRTMLGKHRL